MKDLHSITSRAAKTATLTDTTGRAVAVLKSDRVIFAPDLALLIAGPHAYRVPVALFGEVRRALRLEQVGA